MIWVIKYVIKLNNCMMHSCLVAVAFGGQENHKPKGVDQHTKQFCERKVPNCYSCRGHWARSSSSCHQK